MKIAALPIRLHNAVRAGLVIHFLALDPQDRRLRFGAAISDELVRDYVARIDFERDEVFAITAEDLTVLGVVHVAFGKGANGAAELGVSVLPHARGQGIGNALFERAVIHLRNRGAHSVFMHCLSENQAIMHLARKHGMRIVYSGGESEALLELLPATAETYVTEWMRDQQANAAEVTKQHAHLTRSFFRFFAPALDRATQE